MKSFLFDADALVILDPVNDVTIVGLIASSQLTTVPPLTLLTFGIAIGYPNALGNTLQPVPTPQQLTGTSENNPAGVTFNCGEGEVLYVPLKIPVKANVPVFISSTGGRLALLIS